jgi:ABC-2 type transport system permease protein
MQKIAMFIIGLLKIPIKWCGANYSQVENILKTKLTMDFRPKSLKKGSSGKSFNSFRLQVGINMFMGIFISLWLIPINSLLLNLTIIFSMIIVLLGFTIVTGYSSVLFDHRDNQILLVRPVNDRTLLVSRLLHILVYIGFIAAAISLVPSVIILFKYGILNFIAFWIALGLCSWITLLLTSLLYMVLSKVVSGERFKDMLNYLQIFMSVLIFGGYQIVPRILQQSILKNLTMDIHWWSYLIPPVWLAGFVDLFSRKAVSSENTILALTALFVSIAGASFMVRYLSSGFVDVLSEGAVEKAVNENRGVKRMRGFNLCRLFCISEIERVGWKLAMSITKRDRKFKQAVYPSYGIMIVLAVLMLRPDFSSITATMEKLGDSKNFYLLIFFGFFGISSIAQLPFSDTPEGSWIFKTLPVKNHGHLLTGAVKAMLFKFFLPVTVVLLALTIFIWDIAKVPALILGFFLIILNSQLSIIFSKNSLPFTQSRDMVERGELTARMLIGIFIMGISIGLVYLALKLDTLIIAGICILLFLVMSFLNRIIRNRTYILD